MDFTVPCCYATISGFHIALCVLAYGLCRYLTGDGWSEEGRREVSPARSTGRRTPPARRRDCPEREARRLRRAA